MKKLLSVFILSAMSLAVQANDNPFPKTNPLPAQYFVGQAYMPVTQDRNQDNDFSMGVVVFDKGARTNWHSHPKGQMLIVTDGVGLYQEKGAPARVIKAGELVNIPANVVHWHGASANSDMTHVALATYQDDKIVTWGEPVSDSDYQQANRQLK